MRDFFSLSKAQPSFRINGFKIFIYFVLSIAGSQLFFNVINVLSFLFFIVSILLLLYTLLLGSNADYCFFLFFNCLMRLTIPFFGDREYSLMLPIIFLIAIACKSIFVSFKPKIIYIYINGVSISLSLFFLFVLITFFNNIHFPGGTDNSGFLGRWNLVNTLFVFVCFLLTYKIDMLDTLLENIYKFYKVILLIALLIIIFNIEKIPIFNTFSWILIKENAFTKRMIIAGISGVMVLTYIISFEKFNNKTLVLFFLALLGVLFSGGRSSFLQFFIIIFCYWTVKNRILGKSLLLGLLPVCIFIIFSLSPLVSYVPVKFQRLFIIFPSEFYSDSLREIKKTSAASSSNFRFEMWSKAVSEIPKNLWSGKGFGVPKENYRLDKSGLEAFRGFSSRTLIDDFMITGGLHNTFVSIAFIMGIPAFLFFGYGFIKLIINTYQKSFIFNEKKKRQLTFFTLILIYYFTKSIISDIYLELDFFAFLAIIFKTVYSSQKSGNSIEKKLING